MGSLTEQLLGWTHDCECAGVLTYRIINFTESSLIPTLDELSQRSRRPALPQQHGQDVPEDRAYAPEGTSRQPCQAALLLDQGVPRQTLYVLSFPRSYFKPSATALNLTRPGSLVKGGDRHPTAEAFQHKRLYTLSAE